MTLWPSSARAVAMASPMPLVEPVTIALFCSAIIVLLIVPSDRLDARAREKLGPGAREGDAWIYRRFNPLCRGSTTF